MLSWLMCDSGHLVEVEPLLGFSTTDLHFCWSLLVFKFPSFVVSLLGEMTIPNPHEWSHNSLPRGRQILPRNVLNWDVYLSSLFIWYFIYIEWIFFYLWFKLFVSLPFFFLSLPFFIASSFSSSSPFQTLSKIPTFQYFGNIPSSFHISFPSQKAVISPWSFGSLYWIAIKNHDLGAE